MTCTHHHNMVYCNERGRVHVYRILIVLHHTWNSPSGYLRLSSSTKTVSLKEKNRQLIEGIRRIASGTCIPRFLWEEVAKVVNYIQNRLPCRALNMQTSQETFSGQRHNLSHLRVIGCIAFCHILQEKRTKLDYKAIPTIFLGYDENSKAYRCWNPLSRKIVISRDVVFHRNSFTLNSSLLLAHTSSTY